jgi:hypothetical protein
MIQTEGGYRSTREALGQLELALASMSRRKGEYGPNFREFAEPVVEQILRLRAEIDAYSGLSDYLTAYGPPADEPPAGPAPSAANGPTVEGTAPAIR